MVKNAVKVFPDPVGEHKSKCFLSMIAGIASFWGLVKSGNLSLNQFLTGGDSIASKPSVSCGLSRYSIFTILFHYPSGPQWTQQLLQNFVNTSKRIFHDFIKESNASEDEKHSTASNGSPNNTLCQTVKEQIQQDIGHSKHQTTDFERPF